MNDQFNDPVIKFRDIVTNLKVELEEYCRSHASSEDDFEKVKQDYRTKIVPTLLQLRKLNRISKEKSEEKNEKISEFHRRLVNLKDQCDNITFETACLKYEVVSAKKRLSPVKHRDEGDVYVKTETNGTQGAPFDVDEVGMLDHATRLQVVDREEAKRRNLQERLAEATAETDEIALVCNDSSAQLNRLKPYIRQLLDKVDLGEPIPKKDQ